MAISSKESWCVLYLNWSVVAISSEFWSVFVFKMCPGFVKSAPGEDLLPLRTWGSPPRTWPRLWSPSGRPKARPTSAPTTATFDASCSHDLSWPHDPTGSDLAGPEVSTQLPLLFLWPDSTFPSRVVLVLCGVWIPKVVFVRLSSLRLKLGRLPHWRLHLPDQEDHSLRWWFSV